MSKRNNVNPDHYKIGGREHIGNAVAKAPQPNAVNRDAKERTRDRRSRKRFKF
jgi:hypothetical protein